MLKRIIDNYLLNWKINPTKNPLIVYGARQIGKTTSIREFGKTYSSFIEVNFINEPKYKKAFLDGYSPSTIVKHLSLLNPKFKFIPKNTLIFFDEIQAFPDVLTSLKFFSLDGNYDVICSGNSQEIDYSQVRSVPAGFLYSYNMKSMNFREFLYAHGYDDHVIKEIFNNMINLKPLHSAYINILSNLFKDFIFVGGMPKVVDSFINNKDFSKVLNLQKAIFNDNIEYLNMNIKVKRLYQNIQSQLLKHNHKFQISKVKDNSRSRNYYDCKNWMEDSGLFNQVCNVKNLDFPLKYSIIKNNYKLFFSDHSMFIANLDKASRNDLIVNQNYEIYNGALYEHIVANELDKIDYPLFFYKDEQKNIELDFVFSVKNEFIPIEVKRRRGKSKSLNTLLNEKLVSHAVVLGNNNISFSNNKIYFPYFLTFLLNDFFEKTDLIK